MSDLQRSRAGIIIGLASLFGSYALVGGLYARNQDQATFSTASSPIKIVAGLASSSVHVESNKIVMEGKWVNDPKLELKLTCDWQWYGDRAMLNGSYEESQDIDYDDTEEMIRMADGIIDLKRDLKLEGGGLVTDEVLVMKDGSRSSLRCDRDAYAALPACVPIGDFISGERIAGENDTYQSYCKAIFDDSRAQNELKLAKTRMQRNGQGIALAAATPAP